MHPVFTHKDQENYEIRSFCSYKNIFSFLELDSSTDKMVELVSPRKGHDIRASQKISDDGMKIVTVENRSDMQTSTGSFFLKLLRL